ncbi:MAG: thermonuclease family protein [Nitrospirota bacterium]|nr:thermonuclease family protein [Nitrospirota bacterium]
MLPILLLVLTSLLSSFETFPVSAYANDRHFHQVTFHRCYHAHSCFVTIPYLPPIFGDILMVRLAGVDTPEILGKCEKEKKLAADARNFVNTILENAKKIDLYDLERGQHFNLVARIMANGKNVSDLLIKEKFAVPISSNQSKPDWCSSG